MKKKYVHGQIYVGKSAEMKVNQKKPGFYLFTYDEEGHGDGAGFYSTCGDPYLPEGKIGLSDLGGEETHYSTKDFLKITEQEVQDIKDGKIKIIYLNENYNDKRMTLDAFQKKYNVEIFDFLNVK